MQPYIVLGGALGGGQRGGGTSERGGQGQHLGPARASYDVLGVYSV